MTNEEIKNKVLNIVKKHERLVKLMNELKVETDGAIDFGAINESNEIMVYKGIAEVANALETEAVEMESGIPDFPIQINVHCSKSLLYMIK